MKKTHFFIFLFLITQIGFGQFDSIEKKVIENRTLDIKKYDSALNAFKNGIQDSSFQYIFYYEKSWNFIRSAKYDSSYYFAEKGLHMAIQRNDTAQLVSFYKQVGICYYYNFQKEKAKHAFIKGLSYRNNKINQHNVAALNNNLGGIYTELNLLDSAEYYLENAINIFETLDSTSFGNVLQSKRVLATVYYQDKKNSKAKELLLEVLKSASKVKHPIQKTAALVYLSTILEDEGRYLAALEYTREAYKIQLAENSKDAMLVTVGKLCNNFDKLNLIDSAYHYLQIQNSLRIEVYTDNISDNISKLEVEFETQRARTEKKIALQNERNKTLELEVSEKNNRIIIGSAVIIFLILISIALFFYSQKKIQKSQAEKQIQLERTQAIIEGEEQERERLSRELHDGVGQLLAGVKLNLNALEISDSNTIDLLEKSISEIRNISHDLLPEELKNKDLNRAIESLCSKYTAINKFKIHFKANPIPQLETNTKKHIYRIIQELLSNGIKHSNADNFNLSLNSKDNLLVFVYKDNGKGISGKVLELSTGIGWRNILARLEILSGKVSLDNKASGTILTFKFPI